MLDPCLRPLACQSQGLNPSPWLAFFSLFSAFMSHLKESVFSGFLLRCIPIYHPTHLQSSFMLHEAQAFSGFKKKSGHLDPSRVFLPHV